MRIAPLRFQIAVRLQIPCPTFPHILPNSFNNHDAPIKQERETRLALLIFPSFRLAIFAFCSGTTKAEKGFSDMNASQKRRLAAMPASKVGKDHRKTECR